MKKIKSIIALMTPFPYTIDAKESIDRAALMMDEHKIRHLPVSNEGKLQGVISERDIKLMQQPSFLQHSDNIIKVEDVYSTNIYAVDCSESVETVLEHMSKHGIGSTLVLKENKLVGIFTTVDACYHFARYLREAFPTPPADIVA